MLKLDMLDISDLRKRTSAKWRSYPDDVLPLFVAEMDYVLAPQIAEALHAAIDRSDTGYAWPRTLRETFAEYARASFGWTLEPERVFIVNDVMGGITETLRTLTQPGDGVVIMPPVYAPFFDVVAATERRSVEVPLLEEHCRFDVDWQGLDDAFAAGAKALLLCHPHNPVGRVFARRELERVARIAQRYGALVISDEIHAQLVYGDATHVPFAIVAEAFGLDTVGLMSASKAWNVPGLKCAQLIAGSERIRKRFERLSPEVTARIGHLGVIASVAAYERGHAWLRETLALLDANRHALAALLARHVPGVVYEMPAATYLAWLDCRALPLGPDPARAFLEHGRVALAHGPHFGAAGCGFARLNFATSPAVLAEAVERMARALARSNAR